MMHLDDDIHIPDDDINDPNLDDELGDLDLEIDKQEAEVKQEALDQLKQQALSLKSQGRIEEAKGKLQEMLTVKKELEALQDKIAKAEAKAGKMDLESDEAEDADEDEDEGFDYSSVVSMGVMEYELNRAKQLGNEEVVATLAVKMKILQTNINMNLISFDRYAEDIQEKLNECKAQLKHASPKKREILLKHIELMQAELNHSQAEEEEDEPAMDLDFDYNSIVSISVLMHEAEQAKRRGDTELTNTLQSKIKMLTTKIEMNLMTQEQYVELLTQKCEEYRKTLLNPCSSELRAFYTNHISLMEQELIPPEDDEDEDEDEVQAPPPGSLKTTVAPKADQSQQLKSKESPPVVSGKEPAMAQEVQEIAHEHLLETNRTYHELYDVMEEFKLAITYLKDNGFLEPIEGLLVKAEKLHKQLNCIRTGRPYTFELVSLNPQDLTGMTETERKSKAIALASKAGQLEEEYKAQALEALKAKNTPKAKDCKVLMLQYQELQKQLVAAQLNPWQLLPVMIQEQRIERKEKVNEEIPEGVLEVTVGKLNGASDSDELYTYLILDLSKNNKLRGSTRYSKNCKTQGFDYTHSFEIEAREWPMLDRRRLTVEVYKHRWIRSDEMIGSSAVKMTDLSNSSIVQTVVPIGGRKGPGLELTLKLRRPLKGSEMVEVKTFIDTIGRMPQPFKQPNGSLVYHRPQAQPQPPAQPVRPAQPNPPARQPPQPEESKQVNRSTGPLPDLHPNLDEINCVSVLEQEVGRITGTIREKRFQGEDVKALQVHQMNVMRKKELMKVQIENGTITLPQYLEALERQYASELTRCKAFKERGDGEAFKIVMGRISMVKKEIDDIRSNLG